MTPNLSEDDVANLIKSRLKIRLTYRKPHFWERDGAPIVEVALLWSSSLGDTVIDRDYYSDTKVS